MDISPNPAQALHQGEDAYTQSNAIRQRLRVLFAFAMLVLVCLVFYAIYVSQYFRQQADTIRQNTFTNILYARKINIDFTNELTHWKNILLRGLEPGKYHQYLGEFFQAERITRDRLASLLQQVSESNVRNDLMQIQTLHSQWGRKAREAIRVYNRTDIEPHITADQLTSDIEAHLNQLILRLHENLHRDYEESITAINANSKQQYYLLLLSSILIALVTGLIFFRRIDRDIAKPAAQLLLLDQALRRSEDRYRSLVETTSDWIWEIDAEDNFTYVSPKVTELLGYEPDELIGLSVFDLMAPEEADRVDDVYRQLIENHQSFNGMINVNKHKDGREIIMESSGVPLFDSDGNWCGYRGIDRDITTRVQDEQERNRLLAALNASINEIYMFNTDDLAFSYVSPGAQNNLGYGMDTLREMTPFAIKPDFTETRFMEQLKPLLEKKEKQLIFETVHERADKSRYPVEVRLQLIDEVQPPQFLAIIYDISDRKREEQGRQEAKVRLHKQQTALVSFAQFQQYSGESLNRLFTLLTETSALTLDVERISVWLFNESHSVIICQDLYEASIDQHSTGMALQVKDYPNYFTAMEQNRVIVGNDARKHAETREFSEPYLKPLGINSKLDASLRSGNGKIIGVICCEHVGEVREWKKDEQDFVRSTANMISLSMELTERRKTEKELCLYQEKLEDMVEARTRELETTNSELESFTYSVSHDLRAPLRGINGFSQMLVESHSGQLDETGHDYLARIRAASQRMGQLIEDLLQLSRTTRAELKIAPCDLSATAESVISELRDAWPERMVEVHIESGLKVNTDRRALRAILDNLLGNAWKFTSKETQAIIRLGRLPGSDPATFYVRDNGSGFDMTYANKLFQPFQRLHNEADYTGTGIGLSTVSRLLNRLDGTVWAESEEGDGATFYFTLTTTSKHA